MLVFWQQKLAILATPKTASTAIEAAIGGLASVVIQRPRQLKHTDAPRFEQFWQPYLTQSAGGRFEVAALIREPKAWLSSWYRDGQRDDIEPEKSTLGLSFDQFVQACCTPDHPAAYSKVGSQSAFLARSGTKEDGIGVDHLFRYEDLTNFLHFLEDRLGCEIILPLLNVSPKGDTSLSAQTEARLNEVWRKDFDLYRRAALGKNESAVGCQQARLNRPLF
jgi:hypothetical protein